MTENQFGKGSAVLLNTAASYLAQVAGSREAKQLIVDAVGAAATPPWSAPVLAHRRVANDADHFFLFNEQSGAQTVPLEFRNGLNYTGALDVLANTTLTVSADHVMVTLPAGSASWIRLSKK